MRPLARRARVALAATTIAVLVATFARAVRPIAAIPGSDVTEYEAYGSRMLHGELPYRDFRMEYPPGATLVFVLPATRVLAGGSTEGASWSSPPNSAAERYYHGFTLLVLVLLATVVVLTTLTLGAVARPAGAVLLALAVIAASPLLLERVLTERFDIWPAALTAAALAAAVHGHHRIGGLLLGVGAAAKLYPALLLPTLAIVAVRQRGRREGLWVTGVAAAAAAAIMLPFAIVSPSDTGSALAVQLRGGLQIETLASSVLVMAGHAIEVGGAFGFPAPPRFSTHGAGSGLNRSDLAGPGVAETKVLMNALLAASLCLLWLGAIRSRRDPREDLLRFAAATVALVLVLGTVLSPQYLVWLVPLVPLVAGKRGVLAMLLFAVAAALTNIWIPDHYFEFQDSLLAGQGTLLLARNLALLAIAAVLLVPDELQALKRPRAVV
jgi:hypothetical protein